MKRFVPFALFLAVLGAAQPLQVLYPNGGEVLRAGDTVLIRWRPVGAGAVVIVLFGDGIQQAVLAAQAPDSGCFEWKIPPTQAPGNRFRIRIRSLADLNVNDFSDGDFAVRR